MGQWRRTYEKDAAAAIDCGNIFYGVGWALWAGRHYRHGGVWAGAAAAGDCAAGVEFAYEFDGRGTCFCSTAGGWLLLLGEAGSGWILGVSRGVAKHGGERLRHGDLSGDLCALSREG